MTAENHQFPDFFWLEKMQETNTMCPFSANVLTGKSLELLCIFYCEQEDFFQTSIKKM